MQYTWYFCINSNNCIKIERWYPVSTVSCYSCYSFWLFLSDWAALMWVCLITFNLYLNLVREIRTEHYKMWASTHKNIFSCAYIEIVFLTSACVSQTVSCDGMGCSSAYVHPPPDGWILRSCRSLVVNDLSLLIYSQSQSYHCNHHQPFLSLFSCSWITDNHVGWRFGM